MGVIILHLAVHHYSSVVGFNKCVDLLLLFG